MAGPLIVPEPTVHSPAMTRSRLDLPQPEGPITSSDSPGTNVRQAGRQRQRHRQQTFQNRQPGAQAGKRQPVCRP